MELQGRAAGGIASDRDGGERVWSRNPRVAEIRGIGPTLTSFWLVPERYGIFGKRTITRICTAVCAGAKNSWRRRRADSKAIFAGWNSRVAHRVVSATCTVVDNAANGAYTPRSLQAANAATAADLSQQQIRAVGVSVSDGLGSEKSLEATRLTRPWGSGRIAALSRTSVP